MSNKKGTKYSSKKLDEKIGQKRFQEIRQKNWTRN